MELTQLQKDLILILKHYTEDTSVIIPIMLTLTTEEQMKMLFQYIYENKDKITEEMIMQETMNIIEEMAQSTKSNSLYQKKDYID